MTNGPGVGPPVSARPIGEVRWRDRVRVQGRVRSVRVESLRDGLATLECTVVDGTGGLTATFMGRRQVPGVHVGRRIEVEGTVIESRGELAIMNPEYTLLAD
jgi:RecG-like helicase